jgi:hypothetical protein
MQRTGCVRVWIISGSTGLPEEDITFESFDVIFRNLAVSTSSLLKLKIPTE